MQKALVVFDFDGTIADSYSAVWSLRERLSKEFKIAKAYSVTPEQCREMTWNELRKALEIPVVQIPSIIHKGQKYFRDLQHKIQPLPGIKTALRNLSKMDIQVGILSSNSRENVMRFLERHDMNFSFVAGGAHLWGKARRLTNLFQNEGAAPERVVYVGDEVRDILAARRAGINSLAVSWGFHSARLLRQNAPDSMIDHPDQMAEAVFSLVDRGSMEKAG